LQATFIVTGILPEDFSSCHFLLQKAPAHSSMQWVLLLLPSCASFLLCFLNFKLPTWLGVPLESAFVCIAGFFHFLPVYFFVGWVWLPSSAPQTMYASLRTEGKFLEFLGVKEVCFLWGLLNHLEGEGFS